MEPVRIKNFSFTVRLFFSLILTLIGVNYLFLLTGIWLDTQMDLSKIEEGYSTFETVELLEHSFRYLFWFIGAFGLSIGLFLMSAHSQRLKTIFVMGVPVLIISDIGSMWLVRFSPWFALQLFLSGFLLAASFLILFVLLQRELLFKR